MTDHATDPAEVAPVDDPTPPTGVSGTDVGNDVADDAGNDAGNDVASAGDDVDAAGEAAAEADRGAPSDGATEETDELASQVAAEIQQLAEQRDQYRDLAQRVQADFENYRKRVQSQITAEAERASAKLAEALLPVLDATEAAYLRHPDEIGPLLNLMLAELRKVGLETLDLQDQPFDPNVAEAVAHEAGGGGDAHVAEVLRSGYRWNGRTLRPAMVRTRD